LGGVVNRNGGFCIFGLLANTGRHGRRRGTGVPASGFPQYGLLLWRVVDQLDRRCKLVSASGKRNNVAKVVPAGRQRLAKQKDVLGEVALLDKAVRPDSPEQLFLGKRPQGVLDKVKKKVKGLGWEGNLRTIAADQTLFRVKIKGAETV
jgi:hypothetical protein